MKKKKNLKEFEKLLKLNTRKRCLKAEVVGWHVRKINLDHIGDTDSYSILKITNKVNGKKYVYFKKQYGSNAVINYFDAKTEQDDIKSYESDINTKIDKKYGNITKVYEMIADKQSHKEYVFWNLFKIVWFTNICWSIIGSLYLRVIYDLLGSLSVFIPITMVISLFVFINYYMILFN